MTIAELLGFREKMSVQNLIEKWSSASEEIKAKVPSEIRSSLDTLSSLDNAAKTAQNLYIQFTQALEKLRIAAAAITNPGVIGAQATQLAQQAVVDNSREALTKAFESVKNQILNTEIT